MGRVPHQRMSNRLCLCGHGERIHKGGEGPCQRECPCEAFDESILRHLGEAIIEVSRSQLQVKEEE